MRRIAPAVLALALTLSACGAVAARATPGLRPTATMLPTDQPTAAPRATLPPAQQRPQQGSIRPTLPAVLLAPGQPVDLSRAPDPQPTAEPTSSELPVIPPDDPRSLGSVTAPVTIIVYTDFECPFCARFEQYTAPLIIERYVGTGTVRLVYRDYPIPSLHRSAVVAAVASRCAAAQGKFWQMHDLLFATHLDEWGGVPKRDRLAMVDFADRIALDTVSFERCLDDPQTEQAALDEAKQAKLRGVLGTPSFLINGQLVSGALPIDMFDRLIAVSAQQTR